ncbi:hypothetical protein IB234_09880 [Pseudomonas sp. PDM16]|uniref:hypothetical protein n=1 Tax=Pseudomonas sp. PDM16 TaxID=2769292 RepID=UPI001783BD7A|nr:hypothetical protein [Pseudomonas sp. PDM16]MBD9414872.1 hypothetical protein [Pseudomonas sp. PDM16]
MDFCKTLSVFGFSILLNACATYPQNPEGQAVYHADQAAVSLSRGDSASAVYQIDAVLIRPTGDVKVKKLFDEYPAARGYYRSYLEGRIADVSSGYQAQEVFKKLSLVKAAGVFSEDQMNDFFTALTKLVISGNASGAVPFELDDRTDFFPELKSPVHQQFIVNRAIKVLQGHSATNRPISELMDYVQRIGANSVEGVRIESLLPTMNIRRDELGIVARTFPKFAAARKEEMTTRVFMQVKNGDRILSDDLLQMLRSRVRGVEWVSSGGPKVVTLVIERLRNDERVLPERTETITYSHGEVNFISAALLMPRNASFLYEVVSGGAEVEYGYVISAAADGKTIYDELIRGRVSGEYHRCQNDRIQNVFGGVSSAGFIANNDMQNRCSGPSSTSIDDLRKDVYSKVVGGVLKVPPIKTTHELD